MCHKDSCRETGMEDNAEKVVRNGSYHWNIFIDTLCLSPVLLTHQCNFLDFTWDALVSSKHQIGSCISQVLCIGGWFAGTLLMMGSTWEERWFLCFLSQSTLVLQSIIGLFLGWGSGFVSAFSPEEGVCWNCPCLTEVSLAPKPCSLYRTQYEDRSPANCCSKGTGEVGQKYEKATSVWPDFHSTDFCCLLNLREQLENGTNFYCNWIPNTYQAIYSPVKLCCMQRWGQLFIVRLSQLVRPRCW